MDNESQFSMMTVDLDEVDDRLEEIQDQIDQME